MTWQGYVDEAQVDLNAALKDDATNAADHIRDAMTALQEALEHIEEED